MKKLIAMVLILALPAIALGDGYAIKSGGATSVSILQGSQNTLALDVLLTTDAAATVGFYGGLQAPGAGALTIGSRVFYAPVTNAVWVPANTADATFIGSTVGAALDLGSTAGAAGADIPAGTFTVETITLSGVASLAAGSYVFTVGDSDYGVGAATAPLGSDPVAVASSSSFTLTVNPVPEPVTMLLLAVALPFLRRRSA